MGVKVTFLGSSDAFNAEASCNSACLITAPSVRALLDCGPTILLSLKREGLTANDIDTVLLSHLHGDHFAGLPFLFLAWTYDTPRQRPVTIVGPPGTKAQVLELYRVTYPEPASRPLPFELNCIEVEGGARRRIGSIDLLPIRVPHQKMGVSLGFRIGVDGKTILYAGDTGWTEELVVQSRGTDLFICECSYYETRVDFHLDYPRIAANYQRFGCRRLVLTHIGREVYGHRDEIRLEMATDGLVVEL